MAGQERTVTIRIISAEKPVPSPDADTSEAKTPAPDGSESSSSKKKKKKDPFNVFVAYAWNKTWAQVKSFSKTYIGKYFDVSENYQAQQLMSNAATTIDDLSSVFMAAATGAKLLGPAGAVAGIVAGAAAVTIRQVNTQYTQSAISIIENAYGNYFYGRRAGLVDGGHGTEN